MSVMAIPDGGLHLESSEMSESLPMQAFGITLNDLVIEDLISCIQSGKQIELHLGNSPTLHYGDFEEPLKPGAESLDYDLYLTNLQESKTTAHRFPLPTMSILKAPSAASTRPHIRVEKAVTAKGGKGSKAKALNGKSAMSMALSGSSTTRSLPTSPALTGVASPSHNTVFVAQQQQLEKIKEQRSVVVHELAVCDQAYDYLKERYTGPETELKSTLSKVADKDGDKYSMKKIYWKELDVWNYKYEPSENRQKAIENAKRQYDKQRLETTHEAWERLLEEKDRGKGIILSKLQAQLAKGNLTPAMKPSKAEESSNKNSSDEAPKSKAGGEAMARSNSQPVGSKPKKVSDRETLTKRLLSNKPITAKKAAAATKKAAPASKATKGAADKGGKKFLSAEFVEDSSSEDEAPLATSKPKPMEKSADRAPERVVEKPKEKPAASSTKEKERSPAPVPKAKERSPVPAPKPKAAKPVIRAPRPTSTTTKAATTTSASKRPRDEDDSSSSSGAPLMKRMKPKEAPAKTLSTSTTLKHRPSDASQNSRATPSNVSYKSKNTSPTKSSPLASSPPTNASDLDENSQSSQSQHHDRDRHQVSTSASRVNGRNTTNGNTPNGVSAAKKRPVESQPAPSQPVAKKSRVTKDVLDKAHRFDKFYEKYKILHEQLTRLTNPPKDQVNDLLDMHNRLASMKAEIRREVDPAA